MQHQARILELRCALDRVIVDKSTLLAIQNTAGPTELGPVLRAFPLAPNMQPAATLGQWLARRREEWHDTAAMASLRPRRLKKCAIIAPLNDPSGACRPGIASNPM